MDELDKFTKDGEKVHAGQMEMSLEDEKLIKIKKVEDALNSNIKIMEAYLLLLQGRIKHMDLENSRLIELVGLRMEECCDSIQEHIRILILRKKKEDEELER